MEKITVLGDGSWATALLKILSEKNIKITWHIRTENLYNSILSNSINKDYLSSVKLNLNQISLTLSINKAIEESETIILAIPSQYIADSLKSLNKNCFANKKIISVVKGILPQHNTTPCEYLINNFDLNYNDLAFLSGPSHAEEIALNKLTFLTLYSKNDQLLNNFSKIFENEYIVIKKSTDIEGAEYYTAMKNIMALAVGICNGLGYGDNFTAVLVSNAAKEADNFINLLHPASRNSYGLSYLGDLLVTCYSQFSRNRTFGRMIGRGYSVTSALLELNMISEGYVAVRGIQAISEEKNIELPITTAVYNILYNNGAADEEMKKIFTKLQ